MYHLPCSSNTTDVFVECKGNRMVGHMQKRDFQGQRLADVISNGLPLRDGPGQSSEIGI